MSADAPIKVLCVDDNEDAARTLATMLTILGFDARACADGPAAIPEAAAFRPDACVLDLRMPGMDGYEVARRLRAEFGGRLVLVALSGEARPDPARVAGGGFAGWFPKGVPPTDLVGVLRSAGSPRG